MPRHGDERPGLFAWLAAHREGIFTTLGVLTATAVALVTGQASWQHIVHVGVMVGEPSAAWLPVAIDGMVVTGTVMAAVDRFRGYRTRFWAIIALWWGAVLTLAFNLASAWSRGVWAMAIAVLFATAFIVSVEAIMRPSTKLLMQRIDTKKSESVPVATPEVPEPTSTTSKGQPHPTPTPRRPGRKPGPQNPPNKRRAQPRTSLKAAPAPERKPAPAALASVPGIIDAVVVTEPVPEPSEAPMPVAVGATVTKTEPHDTVES